MANSRKDSRQRKLLPGETERKDGRYMYRYTDTKTGKQKCVYAKKLEELREKERAIQADLDSNLRTDSSSKKLTLNDYFEKYLDVKEVSDSTLVNYRSAWKNNVENTIGQYRIVKVIPSDIMKLYSSLSKKGLAKSSIKRVHNLIHPVFELAVSDRIISENPVKSTWRDYGRETEKKSALTLEQQEQLLEFVEESKTYNVYYPMISVMLETGLRCGELVGLTWDDIDMGKGEIHVRRTMLYKNFGSGMEYRISTPKTKSGERTIPVVSSRLRKALEAQKELNASLEKYSSLEIGGCKDFIFITKVGNPILMCSVNRILDNIVKAINAQKLEHEEEFPHISAHILRHTFCTRMAEKRIDIKVLQTLMGHASSQVTMDIYNHVVGNTRIEDELQRIYDMA